MIERATIHRDGIEPGSRAAPGVPALGPGKQRGRILFAATYRHRERIFRPAVCPQVPEQVIHSVHLSAYLSFDSTVQGSVKATLEQAPPGRVQWSRVGSEFGLTPAESITCVIDDSAPTRLALRAGGAALPAAVASDTSLCRGNADLIGIALIRRKRRVLGMNGPPVVARAEEKSRTEWSSVHAARCRMTTVEIRPKEETNRASQWTKPMMHAATPSLGCVSTYTSKFALAAHAQWMA